MSPPVPRPRQCWQQQQQTNLSLAVGEPKTIGSINHQPTPFSNLTSSNSKTIQLSEDDMYKFLGKDFCLPRSPAITRVENKSQVTSAALTTIGFEENPQSKPPKEKDTITSISKTRNYNVCSISKPPMPLPRSMFLAVKMPPKLPNRPPVATKIMK